MGADQSPEPRALKALWVVGAGLIGGSVAAAARHAMPNLQVWAIDPKAASSAVALGLAHEGFDTPAQATARAEALGIDLSSTALVLAVSAPVAEGLLAEALARPHAWVTDCCSTKGRLIGALGQAPHFVFSHPMAGSEKSGPQAARADLFSHARVLISPTAQSSAAAVAAVENFWLMLGAQPTLLPLEDHDPLLAATSHLPHLVAFALAGALARSPMSQAAQSLYGAGLRDTTRIAGSDPALWRDILIDNRAAVLALLPGWRLALAELAAALEQGDAEGLEATLREASVWRRGFVSRDPS